MYLAVVKPTKLSILCSYIGIEDIHSSDGVLGVDQYWLVWYTDGS
jgi:hypothetical protein